MFWSEAASSPNIEALLNKEVRKIFDSILYIGSVCSINTQNKKYLTVPYFYTKNHYFYIAHSPPFVIYLECCIEGVARGRGHFTGM